MLVIMTCQHLFVYGTLQPGDVRWRHLEPFVENISPDSASGALYDTGLGYPAALFGNTGTIAGQLAKISCDHLEECLALMDEIEGAVEGDYRRVLAHTRSGQQAWAYTYFGDSGLLARIESGCWTPID